MAVEYERPRLNPEADLSRVKLIISDWSGVVSDDRPPVYEANMRMHDKFGLPRINFDHWLSISKANVNRYFAENFGLNLEEDVVNTEYLEAFQSARTDGFAPTIYPDALPIFAKLSNDGFKIAVVSAHPTRFLNNEVEEYGLSKYISSIEGGLSDKTPLILQSCQENNIIDRKTALYMGDTTSDIKAAQNAKVISVAMTTGYHLEENLRAESPDHVFHSLTELYNAVTNAR